MSPTVPGGSFLRSYDGVTFTRTENPATVSTFRLDRFEVTVGRFRAFVAAVVPGWSPAAGSGKHAHLNGGLGLAQTSGGLHEPGWDSAWNGELARSFQGWDEALTCVQVEYNTWTSAPGPNERRPLTCASWFEASAFCIWDGGFLPSEAEWNYAAAGGAEQRVFPWSVPPASSALDCTYANHALGFPAPACGQPGTKDVGSVSPKGDGRWGQADLGGNVYELNADWFGPPVPPLYAGAAPYSSPCVDCANFSGPPGTDGLPVTLDRALRGGSFRGDGTFMHASHRNSWRLSDRMDDIGFRCARSPDVRPR